MRKNEKGFGVVEILLVIVVIGLLGVGGWMFFSKQKDSKTAKNEVTNNTQQSEQAKTNETKKQEEIKPDTNASYLVIKEWNVKFLIPNSLGKVTYSIGPRQDPNYAALSGSLTGELDKYSFSTKCTLLGITRSTSGEAPQAEPGATKLGKIGADYFYSTLQRRASPCSGFPEYKAEGGLNSELKVNDLLIEMVKQPVAI
jgi:type II secretory pathway pseudopilin PulG